MTSLSVLDLAPIAEGSDAATALTCALDLAQHAERWGYRRYWLAEHHNMDGLACSATAVLVGHIAGGTHTIRVGSGGIMLPNHAPLVVAEQFGTLATLYPGRIDLGLGRAPGTDGRTALALRRSREALAADDFPTQIALLRAFAGETPWPAGSVFDGVLAEPRGVKLPPLWILGSSLYGAQLAGELGVGYAFAYHFSQEDPAVAVQTYHRHFRPGPLAEPYAILGVNALAAPTEDEARDLSLTSAALSLGILSGQRGVLRSPEEARQWLQEMDTDPAKLLKKARIGTPEQVWASLQELGESTGAQEMLVTTYAHDPLKRQQSYRLLAQAAGMTPQKEA